MSCKSREHTLNVGDFRLGGVSRLRRGNAQNLAYSFSFNCDLITVVQDHVIHNFME